jgi:hypothetical protein
MGSFLETSTVFNILSVQKVRIPINNGLTFSLIFRMSEVPQNAWLDLSALCYRHDTNILTAMVVVAKLHASRSQQNLTALQHDSGTQASEESSELAA